MSEEEICVELGDMGAKIESYIRHNWLLICSKSKEQLEEERNFAKCLFRPLLESHPETISVIWSSKDNKLNFAVKSREKKETWKDEDDILFRSICKIYMRHLEKNHNREHIPGVIIFEQKADSEGEL